MPPQARSGPAAKQRCTCGCNTDRHPATIARHLKGKAALSIRASVAASTHQEALQDGSHPVKRARVWIAPLDRARTLAAVEELQRNGTAAGDSEADASGLDMQMEVIEGEAPFPEDSGAPWRGEEAARDEETQEFEPDRVPGGSSSLDHPDADVQLQESEDVWAGFGQSRRTTVEDIEDEDDLLGTGDHSEDGYMEIEVEDEVPDEFEAISVWDELAEALMRAAGSTADDLTEHDMEYLRPFALKVDSHMTSATFAKLPYAFPHSNIATWKAIQACIAQLSGFEPQAYDCCVNSCCCFVGPHADANTCPYCHENRRNASGRPRKIFIYLPIIPRLKAYLANPEMARKMRYRAHEHVHEEGVIKDVPDSRHYRSLVDKKVVVSGRELPHKFFEDPREVALGLSTDGFAPFRRRTKTAWPLVLYNYNLPPEIRFHLANIIGVGVIPGPKKPHDMDSFLWPLVQEFLRLAIGVHAHDSLSDEFFALRAFLILVFGDIPAISMVMCMKGHNGATPCRMCSIRGIRIPNSTNPIHYVPLDRSRHPDIISSPEDHTASYIPNALPLRSHDEFLAQAREVQFAPTDAESERLAKAYGIKSLPILHVLPSISFPHSFPYDFMHLLWENVVKNLMNLWTGQYKGLDTGLEDYEIQPTVWEAIGSASAKAGDTIPGIFGPRPPNVASDKMSWTADTRSFWFQFVGPVLLARRFKHRKYYDHFVLLVKIIRRCLQFEIASEEIMQIRGDVIAWVQTYEKFYYQYNPARLPMCPLTIHALLHIADSIEMVGPVWASWAFPMERYCGALQPAIRSRRFPYSSLHRYVLDRARLDHLKLIYSGLHAKLNFSPPRSQAAIAIPGYDTCVLLPPRRPLAVDRALQDKLLSCLCTRFTVPPSLLRPLLPSSVEQFGKVRILNDGDTMRAAELAPSLEDTRDATYVRVL